MFVCLCVCGVEWVSVHTNNIESKRGHEFLGLQGYGRNVMGMKKRK